MEDPLAGEFDVLVLGTGLAQAMLAAALGRAGKKVLHLDHRPYYGADEAAMLPSELDDLLAAQSSITPETPALHGIAGAIEALERAGVPPEEVDATRGPTIHGRHAPCSALLPEAQFEPEELPPREKRRISVDLSPRLVMGKGRLVSALINSGVAQYLEFHALEGSLMARRDLGSDAPLLRVPSTKQEVFRSRDLGLAEKRFLMKFMQRCFDEAVEDAATQNENALNVGRALSRPQNKRASADAHRGAGEAEDENEPAVAALDSKMSPALRDAVLYSIACLDRDPDAHGVTAKELRARIQQYVTSLGQYSVTAFLAPVYGASELGQGFCRMAAVSGSVYVLRRHLTALLTRKSTGAVLGAMDSEGTFLRAKAVVAEEGAMAAWAEDGAPAFTLAEAAEGRGVSEPPQDAQPGAEGGEEAGGPEAGEGDGAGSAQAAGAETSEVDRERYSARARTLLDALGALPPPPAPRWAPTVVARAVAVFDRPLLPHRATEHGLSMLVVPPNAEPLRHPEPTVVHQLDSRLLCCPQGTVLVQLSCLSHGDSAEEAGQKGCCVLRDAVASLAAIADAAGGGEAATAGAASSDSLGDSAAGGADSTAQRKPWKVHLWRVFYTRFLLPCDPDAAAHKPSNVHVPRSAPALCMFSEADVVTAEQEFRALCPGLDFLPPKEDHPAEAEVEDVEIEAALAKRASTEEGNSASRGEVGPSEEPSGEGDGGEE